MGLPVFLYPFDPFYATIWTRAYWGNEHSMMKQRIAANLLAMGTGQIATWVISTVAVILTSRYLHPDGAGKLATASAVVSVLSLIVGLGMDTLIVRTVAREPERTSVISSAAIFVRAMLVVPVLVLLYLWTHIAPHYTPEIRAASYILATSMIIGAFGGIITATLQGREKMSLAALGAVALNLLDLMLTVVVVRLHGSILAFAAIQVAGALLMLVLNLRWIRQFAPLTRHVSLRDMREVVRGSLSFWANSVFLTIYIYIDTIILNSLADTRAVGDYGAATRMFSVAFFVPGIIGSATLPMLSRLGIDKTADFTRAARKTLAMLIACMAPVTIGLATFARPLILTLYSSSFTGAVPALVILSLCIPCTYLNIQAAQMLAARDQQWRWTRIMGISCVVNPLINLAIIPLAQARLHDAAMGAALSLLATELLMAVYAVAMLRDILWERTLARVAAASLVAGGAQLSVVLLASMLWPPLGQALGVAAYGLVAIALGALPRADVAVLYEVVSRRMRHLEPIARR